MTKKYFFISLLLIPIIASTQQLTLVDAINIALKKNYDIEIEGLDEVL
jgi:hypothetical protein